MNWNRWKIGLTVAALTGLLTGVIGLGIGITWRQALILLGVSIAKDALLFIKDHPADAISDIPPTGKAPGPGTAGFSILPLLVFLAMVAVLLLAGCAYMHSTTTRATDPKTGVITETTVATGYTMFDGNAQLAKFSNRSGYVDGTNRLAPGTYVSGLQESSSSSNLVLILPGVAGAVVQGLK